MYETIRKDHAILRTFMVDFAQQTARPFAETGYAVIQGRLAFWKLYQSHLANLDAAAAMLPASAGETRISSAMHCIASMPALSGSYGDHLRKWTPQDIAADMTGYHAAVVSLQRRLIDQFDVQERALLPLLHRKAA